MRIHILILNFKGLNLFKFVCCEKIPIFWLLLTDLFTTVLRLKFLIGVTAYYIPSIFKQALNNDFVLTILQIIPNFHDKRQRHCYENNYQPFKC